MTNRTTTKARATGLLGAVALALCLLCEGAAATIVYQFAGIIDQCQDCGFNVGDTLFATVGFADGTDTTSGQAFGTADVEYINLPAPFPTSLLLANASGIATGVFRDAPNGRLNAVGIFQMMSFGFDNENNVGWNLSFFQFPPTRIASGSSFTFTRVPEPASAALVALGIVALRRRPRRA